MSLTALAMPAKPGKTLLKQPDGTEIEVYLHGDEWFHYYETTDGKVLMPGTDGVLKYALLDKSGKAVAGKVSATNPKRRAKGEIAAAAGASVSALRPALVRQAEEARHNANTPGAIKTVFPTKGTVRGLIILAEYQDVKFTKGTLEEYRKIANEEGYKSEVTPGSMRDYFITQSNGQFTPEFDVVGPVLLPNNREYYGGSSTGSERVRDMIVDATRLAHDSLKVDFTKYDSNNDDYIDFLYVIYAGQGQAQGGPEESVWPCAMDLSNDVGSGNYEKYIGRTACSCELFGGTDIRPENRRIDGIGTFCHEFSHILGLPDIYDVLYTEMFGMGHYDIMDLAGYNNEGRTPGGYTAMDKYTVGWLQPEVLDASEKDITLGDLTETNKAYFLVSGKDKNEYYTLENRQPTPWDEALPGHGLLVSHIKYVKYNWNSNTVNTTRAGFEHVQLVAADNAWTDDSEADDVYPGNGGQFTALSADTKPALTWRTGEQTNGQAITNIRLQDGKVIFDYTAPTTSAISDINADTDDAHDYYTLEGVNVGKKPAAKGVYIKGGKKVVLK